MNKHGDKHLKQLVGKLVREHKFILDTRKNGTSKLYPRNNQNVRPFTLHQFNYSMLAPLKSWVEKQGVKLNS